MVNKILAAYVAADMLLLTMGCIMLGFSVIAQNVMNTTPADGGQAVRNLLYQQFPLTAGIANAVLMFATFVVSLPALSLSQRGWLKAAGYLATLSAVFSVILGLYLWILTLKTKALLSPIWLTQTPQVQDLMQTTFSCCGYFNSTSPAFVTDSTCPSPASAALIRGCATPLSSFANIFVDDIFTAVFGMAAVDAVFIIATACLLKNRKEETRFRYIDAKSGRGYSF